VLSHPLLLGATIVASTHPAILLWTDSEVRALLVAEADIDAAASPLSHGGVKVGDVLTAQLDQNPAQCRWIVDREVTATFIARKALSNADYWYQRSGSNFRRTTLAAEWAGRVEALLAETANG